MYARMHFKQPANGVKWTKLKKEKEKSVEIVCFTMFSRNRTIESSGRVIYVSVALNTVK